MIIGRPATWGHAHQLPMEKNDGDDGRKVWKRRFAPKQLPTTIIAAGVLF